jgi:hypothetical protein
MRSCEAPKFDQARLVWVQLQSKLPQAFPPFLEESLSVRAVLKSQNTIVSITDHYHFPCGPMLPPVLYPKIENIMQIDIRKQRRDHRALRSPHFRLRPFPILGYSRPQPLLDQAKYPSISDAVLEELDHPFV